MTDLLITWELLATISLLNLSITDKFNSMQLFNLGKVNFVFYFIKVPQCFWLKYHIHFALILEHGDPLIFENLKY